MLSVYFPSTHLLSIIVGLHPLDSQLICGLFKLLNVMQYISITQITLRAFVWNLIIAHSVQNMLVNVLHAMHFDIRLGMMLSSSTDGRVLNVLMFNYNPTQVIIPCNHRHKDLFLKTESVIFTFNLNSGPIITCL